MAKEMHKNRAAIKEDTSYLPCDIIFSILSELPVKSLLRFRCVSKPWKAMISDPEFAKTQYLKSKRLDREKVLLRMDLTSFTLLDYKNSKFSMENQQLPVESLGDPIPLCSGDGLVLLKSSLAKQTFALWNPSIRKHRVFSCPYEVPKSHYLNLHGVYYNSRLDDYKVILRIDNSFYTLYSLKNNSWAEKKSFPFKGCWCDEGFMAGHVRAEGGVYWKLFYHPPAALHLSTRIVCFDAISEEFKIVPWPNCAVRDLRYGFITCFKGRFTVSSVNDQNITTQIWALTQGEEEDDERASWVSLRDFQSSWLNLSNTRSWHETRNRVLCSTQCGEALFQRGSTIIVGDLSDPSNCCVVDFLETYIDDQIMLPCLDSLYFPIADGTDT